MERRNDLGEGGRRDIEPPGLARAPPPQTPASEAPDTSAEGTSGWSALATAWHGRGQVGMGLSARLLVLTVLFIMLGEVLIYVPAVAHYRVTWLEDRLNAALIASHALDARGDGRVPDKVRADLMSQAGILGVSIKRNDLRELVLQPEPGLQPERSFKLEEDPFTLIGDAFDTLLAGHQRVVRVYGVPNMSGGEVMDIVLNEVPLRRAMLAYSGRILTVSIAISAITLCLLYLSLHRVLVRPIRRLTASMTDFPRDPEDPRRVIVPSEREDEIGVAERALATMQSDLRVALKQKTHLAALGTAVSKINHDLRNMLSTVQLFSDRFSESADPVVQRELPKMMRAIDRAVQLTTETLRFGAVDEPPPRPRRFALWSLVNEVGASLPLREGAGVTWCNEIDPALELEADPDQVFRILLNLGRNAVQALKDAGRAGTVLLRAARDGEGGAVAVDIADDGPGIPDAVREKLFVAFATGRRGAGTGLGLPIARDLARGHGGDITLVKSDANGTHFRLALPDRAHFH